VFTVLILSDAAEELLGESKVFFEPFEEAGVVAFCRWNQSPEALTLAQALPELRDIIRGKKEWRAVVVDHMAGAEDPTRSAENPFDFLDNESPELNLDDSQHPLVRVSHLLLGYPEMSALAFEPMLSYRDLETGERVYLSASDLHAENPAASFGETLAGLSTDKSKYDVQVHFNEIEYGAAEKARHRELAKRYRMKEVRPTEVVFVSTRTPVEVDSKAQLHRAWRSEDERMPARFVERNDYPASSRFAVYDLLNRENSGYEQDALRFWLTVLTIATNLLPPSAFQAEHVYRVAIAISDELLGELLNTHLSRLTDVRDRLSRMIDRPRRVPDTSVSDYLQVQRVPLEFDQIGGADLRVATDRYSLVTDLPRNEMVRWESDFSDLRLGVDGFLRGPRRVLKRAVFDARERIRSVSAVQHSLSAIEREEIEEEIGRSLMELTVPATIDILDGAQALSALREQDHRVRAYIRQRMRRTTVLMAGGISLGVWFAAFVPYLLQAATMGAAPLASAVLVTVGVLAAIGLAVFGVLLWMRYRLVRMISAVNSAARAMVSRVNNGAAVFADYLSDLATHMHARALLRGAREEEVQEVANLRRWLSLRARIEATIGVEKGILASLGIVPETSRLPSAATMLDPQDEDAVRAVFQFPVADSARARFNDTGETIAAPYDFVTRLELERVPLFELRSTDPSSVIPESI
jgi:hypothetical protein